MKLHSKGKTLNINCARKLHKPMKQRMLIKFLGQRLKLLEQDDIL